MEYEWNPLKAESNLTKHGIDFAEAVTIFADDYLVTIEDPHPEEERFVAIGMDGLFRILVVSFTW